MHVRFPHQVITGRPPEAFSVATSSLNIIPLNLAAVSLLNSHALATLESSMNDALASALYFSSDGKSQILMKSSFDVEFQ